MAYIDHVGNTILNSFTQNVANVVSTMGRAGLHALAPDQFEYYLCSFELMNSQGATVAFMNFPVMPNSISETEAKIIDIAKTNSGIVTMFNSSFTPKDISLQGTFGRKFRIIGGLKDIPNGDKTITSIMNGNLGFSMFGNEVRVKTGFGLTNLLRRIIKKTTETDDYGMPYVLLFNNYALNSSYVVEVLSSSFNQSVENNMLWFYSLEMKAVAPAEVVKKTTAKNLLGLVSANSIAQGIQGILSDSVRSLMQF
jgi:hypothetical protein